MNTSAMKIEVNHLQTRLHELGEAARVAYRQLAHATSEQKNKALLASAEYIEKSKDTILQNNAADMNAAKEKGLTGPLLDRLLLDEKRVKAMADGVRAVAELPDPVGKLVTEWDRPNGLHISRVSVPLGVIGIIYESRPNVTADAAALCIKSGNAVILRGGSESFNSSQAIELCFMAGLADAGLPSNAVQLVRTQSRDAVGIMLKMVGLIDVIVPRGGVSLTQRVAEESRIPTILHLDGNCHTYLHEKADLEKAVAITFNAKMRRTGICGATESILVDKSIVETIWPAVAKKLLDEGCEVRADIRAKTADARIKDASEQDWGTEYLDKIVSVKTVHDAVEAIQHINHYSSHHTDAIITEDKAAAEQFLKGVDSAIVLHNASTQFADGGEFGLGAEIGISTGRLHARGPVGADQLVTYKYVVHGNGQIRPV